MTAQSLDASAALRRRVAELENKLEATARELSEAQAREVATSAILKLIAASPADATHVFDAIAASAKRLLGGFSASVWRFEGDVAHLAAYTSISAEADAALRARSPLPLREIHEGAALVRGEIGQIPDTEQASETVRTVARQRGYRARLYAPLMRQGSVAGFIGVTRATPGAFAPHHVQLLKTFADQAVIAIENALLFKETQEALERQTATSEILEVIASSPSDVTPVFAAIAERARALSGSRIGSAVRFDGELLHMIAFRGSSPEAEAAMHAAFPMKPGNGSLNARVIAGLVPLQIPDIELDPHYQLGDVAKKGDYRALLAVPMIHEGRAIGAIGVGRDEPGAFPDKIVSLLQTFASQAVIALENTRLFNETKEALERQTATAEVLKVISRSVSDAAPVFEAILDSCQRLFGLEAVAVYLVEGEMVRGVAQKGWDSGDWGRDAQPLAGSSTGQAIAERRALHFPDLADKPDLPEKIVRTVREAGGLSVLYAPMLLADHGVGSIVVSRKPAKPFTEREIALVQSFADQAAIAIQNARLFNETKEALERQTATADVLKVISRSAFDLDSVTTAILETAARLCRAPLGTLHLRDGEVCRLVTQFGWSEAFEQIARDNPIPARYPLHSRRPMRAGEFAQFADASSDPEYLYQSSAKLGGYRAIIVIPMMRENELVGIFSLARPEPELFTPGQIKLVQTFADQAVIAIENARLFGEVKARTRDLSEALERQTATNEVLSVISRSPSDLMPVLETISDTASRLCGSEQTIFFRFDGEVFRFLASWNFPAEVKEMLERRPIWPGHPSALGRAGATLKPVYIPDVLADPDYGLKGEQQAARYRTTMAVPLLREGRLIGALSLNRAEPGAFTDKHAELVGTFADQAVIAIENTRLFEEVQARTRDLSEALQQQTATAEVLKVISRSAFDLQMVFDALLSSAVDLVGGVGGAIALREGDELRFRAGSSPGGTWPIDFVGRLIPIDRSSAAGRAAGSGRIEYVPDADADLEFHRVASGAFGVSYLGVPLARDGRVEGALTIISARKHAFTQRHIDLVQTFADQAVIAIENVRLFNEVQARTRDLTEALQMQTATSDVLKVISRSAFDLQAVFNTLITSAVELGGALTGTICVRDGDVYRYRDTVGAELTSALAKYLREHPAVPSRSTIAGRVLLSGKVERIPDCLADPEYVVPMGALASNVRSLLGVPLLRKEGVEGALILTRDQPGEFSQRQIEIVQTFADQAVIALENVRLFDEVQARTRDLEESLAQQTATADVLKVISRSAFDLQAVLDTLVASAVRLFGADNGIMYLQRGDAFYVRAAFNTVEFHNIVERLREQPHRPGRGSVGARVLLTGEIQHVPDIQSDPEYDARLRVASVGRAVLGVPLKRDGSVVGAIIFVRRNAGAYLPRQVEIAQTFADQAVIAIENSRLFDQLEARTRELEHSLDDLRKAQDRLVQSEKLASLGQLTAGIAHEIKNPLNFVNNFSQLSRELLEELRELLAKAKLAEDERQEGDELIGMIGSNLDKVVTHGKRADSIVKNMLLHSREGSGERSSVNVNAMVEEALNLAYHGARAEKPDFNVTIAKSLDPQAGVAELYAQEMTRVLLNLISNGFYATTKRKQAEPAYEPTITASTRDLGDSVEIRVSDNGTGISEAVKAKMFNPFFTTKPAGEGTGLGLSLSHDIVVKQHGGTIDVATEPGAYTQFTIRLPRAGMPK